MGILRELDEKRLALEELVELVISEARYQTNEVFDYLWERQLSEVSIYKLVSKCMFFQSEYVIEKLMTIHFPPSLIIFFIKHTRLGLTAQMLKFLKKNSPSGTDVTFLLYDSPQFLNEETFSLFVSRTRTYHEVMTVLDHAKGLTDEQHQALLNLCAFLAVEKSEE
ncbi:MAG: hypothetical protein ACKO1F_13430 [Flammeovirgaceae bacterium]